MLMMTPKVAEPEMGTKRYTPPKMTPRAAERANRLSAQRVPVEFAPGWNFLFVPSPDEQAWMEAGAPIEVDVRIDGETVHIRTVWSVLEAELVAALIETHLVENIFALEAVLGVSCLVERVGKVRDHGTKAKLDARIFVNGSTEPFPAAIYATPSTLGMLAAAWEQSPRVDRPNFADTFVLAVRVAISSVSRNGLKGLAVGDALLFDRVAPDGGVVLCVGEYLTSVGQLTETGEVTVGSPFSVESPYLLGEFQMSDALGF